MLDQFEQLQIMDSIIEEAIAKIMEDGLDLNDVIAKIDNAKEDAINAAEDAIWGKLNLQQRQECSRQLHEMISPPLCPEYVADLAAQCLEGGFGIEDALDQIKTTGRLFGRPVQEEEFRSQLFNLGLADRGVLTDEEIHHDPEWIVLHEARIIQTMVEKGHMMFNRKNTEKIPSISLGESRHLIEPAREAFDCGICGDSIDPTTNQLCEILEDIVPPEADHNVVYAVRLVKGVCIQTCQHSVCLDCFKEYLVAQLEENPLFFISGDEDPEHPIPKEFYDIHINCPMAASDTPCETKLQRKVLLSTLLIDDCQKYHKRAQNVIQSKLDDFKHAEEEKKKSAEQRLAEEKATEEILGQHQRCPKPECNVPIFRFEGCDWMKCPKCTHEFCYKCRQPHNHDAGGVKHVCTGPIQTFTQLKDGVVIAKK